MKAVRCTVVGSLGDLVVEEMVAPSMRPACVRVAVEAAGLNYVDALFVQGRYQLKPAPPFTPGSELAGTVIEVADDVESISVGERVIASVGLGGFAEQVVLPAERASPPGSRAPLPPHSPRASAPLCSPLSTGLGWCAARPSWSLAAAEGSVMPRSRSLLPSVRTSSPPLRHHRRSPTRKLQEPRQ